MYWGKLVLVAGAMALSLVGCSDRVSSPVDGDAERALLRERVVALHARVNASGRMTVDQRRELEDVTRDIAAWQARTGRHDLAVTTSRLAQDPGVSALVSRGSGPTSSCLPCPPVKVFGTQICFLVTDYCGYPDGIITRACSYKCIWA